MKTITASLTILLFVTRLGFSQGFINLDFESANLSAYGAGFVPAPDAIPGWTAYIDGVSQANIFYNELSLGAPAVAVFGTNGFYNVIDGAYSIDLYGGSMVSAGVSISQPGTVPASAKSILFKAENNGPLFTGVLLVSLGGQNIPYFSLSTGPNYTLYGGNIPSAFAGQSEQLTFSALQGGNNYWEIDDIQFSPSPVPEPTSLAVAAFGALLFGSRRWRTST